MEEVELEKTTGEFFYVTSENACFLNKGIFYAKCYGTFTDAYQTAKVIYNASDLYEKGYDYEATKLLSEHFVVR